MSEIAMKGSNRELKQVSELTQRDFAAHPVWTWADTMDESLVTPLGDNRILDEDHDALFVACDFILNDRIRLVGNLSAGADNHKVYLLSFPKPDGKFFNYPLHPDRRGEVTPAQLAAFLGRAVEQVFPLAYETPFVWPNGEPLRGKIEAT